VETQSTRREDALNYPAHAAVLPGASLAVSAYGANGATKGKTFFQTWKC